MATEIPSYDGQSFSLPKQDPALTEANKPLGNDVIKPISKKQKAKAAVGVLLISGALFGTGRVTEDKAHDNLENLNSEHALVIDNFSREEAEIKSQLTSPMQEATVFESLSILRENHQAELEPIARETELQEGYAAFGDKLEKSGALLALGGVVTLGAVELFSRKPSSPKESREPNPTS